MFKQLNTIESAKGMTLIELVMTMAIATIAILGGYALLIGIEGTRAGTNEVVQVQQEARNLAERMTRELREGNVYEVWPSSLYTEESNYITFYTARDSNKVFNVESNGLLIWKSVVTYQFDGFSNELIRSQSDITGENYYAEVLSKNVERMAFSLDPLTNMLTISIRTFVDWTGKPGNIPKSYSEFTTEIKLRN